MSELLMHEDLDGFDDTEPVADAGVLEVRRNGGLAAGIGGVAAVVGILYLSRATGTGAWLDWALCLVMGGVAAAYLQGFLDARTPLLVGDEHGVRVRQGRTWHGLPWDAVEVVEHLPRRHLWRDGRLTVVPVDGDAVAVPLSLSTRVVGADGDLTGSLAALAAGRADVVEIVETVEPAPAGEVSLDDGHDGDEVDEVDEVDEDFRPEPEPARSVVASATPSPLRDPVSAARIEVRSDLVVGANALHLDAVDADDDLGGRGRADLPEARELRRPGSVSLVEDTEVWGARVRPIARPGEVVEPLVIDDFPVEPAPDPVIGPELSAARTRLGLTVDQLAERTRIRPHVIESIEADDFAPCGGDFYARGHLRTLARVLGIEAAPLLETYDERYADAPINPRRVFEAELASGANGGIRSTLGGPNWSVLVAAVMVVVLAWSVARLVMDSPVSLNDAPALNGSGGLAQPGDPVPVLLDAAGGGASVKVVDGHGKVVFEGDLAFGQTRVLRKVATPVEVTTSDGSLKVALDGGEATEVGDTGARARRTFGTR